MSIAIQVQGLSKKYLISHQRTRGHASLRADLMGLFRRDSAKVREGELEEFWALKDVSFEIRQGEKVGIIGRNGAGKSTLLKILSRITDPTAGKATIHGRVASLLEVGTGFHPDLSGRENVFLNGAILGMRRQEIQKKFDEIVAFAEVEKFIDTPVKRYSSGMYVRLAFAVAAHLDPEILIIDEVLAVGDMAFQKKCFTKLNSIGDNGATILFVSHNIAAIQNLCTEALVLKDGRMHGYGDVDSVIHKYLEQSRQLALTDLDKRMDRAGNGQIRFISVAMQDGLGRELYVFHAGQHAKLTFVFKSVIKINPGTVLFAAGLDNEYGQRIACFYKEMILSEALDSDEMHAFEIEVLQWPLVPGNYQITIHCEINGVVVDSIRDACSILVEAGDFFGTGRLPPGASQGQFFIQHQCKLTHVSR